MIKNALTADHDDGFLSKTRATFRTGRSSHAIPAMTSAFWRVRHALVWPSSKRWSPPALGEMPANLAGRKLGSAEPAAGHSPPRRTSALCFGAPQSLIRLPTSCSRMPRASAHMVRDRGPFRADREVGSHAPFEDAFAITLLSALSGEGLPAALAELLHLMRSARGFSEHRRHTI